jgi:hypothetical protein
VDLSFTNSVTGSGFVAKCSNILQDVSFVVSDGDPRAEEHPRRVGVPEVEAEGEVDVAQG